MANIVFQPWSPQAVFAAVGTNVANWTGFNPPGTLTDASGNPVDAAGNPIGAAAGTGGGFVQVVSGQAGGGIPVVLANGVQTNIAGVVSPQQFNGLVKRVMNLEMYTAAGFTYLADQLGVLAPGEEEEDEDNMMMWIIMLVALVVLLPQLFAGGTITLNTLLPFLPLLLIFMGDGFSFGGDDNGMMMMILFIVAAVVILPLLLPPAP